ncbi:hypothetical protein ACFL37_01405 [Candidatus Margulisiibacteriota bacterium]
MKFLVEFTTLTYVLKHGIARCLNELYSGSSFAALIGSHVDTIGYLKDRSEVPYEAFYDLRTLPAEFLKQEANLELLEEFEETLPEKSLWRLISMDRDWAHQFVKTAVRKRSYVHDINDHENILRVASGFVKFYKEVLEQFRPDVVLPAAGMNSMGAAILEQMCHNLGIHYLVPESLRTLNYMALSPNRKYTYPQIDDTYDKLLSGQLELDTTGGEKLYQELVESLDCKYFDRTRMSDLKHRRPWLSFAFNVVKGSLAELRNWLKHQIKSSDPDLLPGQPKGLGTLMSNMNYVIKWHYQKIKFFDPALFDKYDPKQKYIYLPLQNTPEYSTQVRATMWINQLVMIEALAKSLPIGHKLYVREHPGTLKTRVRDLSIFKEIKSYPNVDLIPMDIDSEEVIRNAVLVINTTGTSGWEAVRRGIPVINLAENLYDVLELSARCTDLEQLSIVIHDEIIRNASILAEERKKRLVLFFTAMLKHAFWFDNPLLITGDAPCSEAKAREMGSIICQGIKQYLDENAKENNQYAAKV